MAVVKKFLRMNEDGTPHFLYTSDTDSPLVVTGPHIYGTVTLSDGTEYDVNDLVIEAPIEHHGEISHAIGMRHETEGHPMHDAENPFIHICTDHCGTAKLADHTDEAVQARYLEAKSLEREGEK